MHRFQVGLAKYLKSLRIRIMNCKKYFLFVALILASCGNEPDEELIDLDQMVLAEDEYVTDHLEGDPLFSPQEVLFHSE